MQDNDLKVRMVKSLELAKDCLSEAKMRTRPTFSPAGTDPDPDLTAIAILAAELFKHIEPQS